LSPYLLPLNSLDYCNHRVLKPKGYATAHQKMGAQKRTVWQLGAAKVGAMLRQNCGELRLRLEMVVAVGGGNSD
jgi:hypothetical protein